MSEFETPGRCKDCPNLCELGSQISEIREQTRARVEEALNADEILRAGLGMMGLDEADIESVMSRPDAAEVIGRLRSGVAEWADQGDDIADRGIALAKACIDACQGQLKMRAKAPDGRTVTVTVCGSAVNPDGHSHERVHAVRESK